ncbi:MAG: 3-deoxy-manno-octulosonate cytidylyltransferase [Deltaproteobacteria bacterium]|jgi:3-deoxy-manno-octulosonate cytidylyltransferase (CMP-KDO synthetase)|nr:3-deoxy-manno-octulosonate cytidylyltransferase [Deltaproteobacteria bacterium]
MSPKIVAIIPARWESSRFPGKPLALLAGLPMIQHVYQRAQLIPNVASIHVATDDERIFQVVANFGGHALMTSPKLPSGSDRLAEAATLLDLAKDDIVINVQGDQPCLNPEHPKLLAEALLAGSAPVATLAIPFADPQEIANPNHVKTVFDQNGRALYFSRSPIPFYRDSPGEYYKHIGLYAYQVDFLRQYVAWEPSRLELAEKLEQLRILERGLAIQIVLGEGLSPEVDTPEDLLIAEAALAKLTQKA